jgi:crotonobetainyl-CoA:carnitine CoA-transferase CaiB-like acyl-CoA transferase
LAGLKILEMGQLLAGPFASTLLAWFGAEVIKIEPPGKGDALRAWRGLHDGTSLWWATMARNKKSITLNLREPKGQQIARSLAANVDVVLENFKPGTLEKWGLGHDVLEADNPGLIMVRVSGWGQTGPRSAEPGYASVAEGVGGLRYVTGYPDRPPVRSNLSLGDTIAGLHAALGLLTALYHREHAGEGKGQVVDVAIYEAVFNMMESALPELDLLGELRERQGSKLSGIVPSNTYECADGKFIIIGGNGDSIFKRLMRAAGREDLASDSRLEQNDGRVRHEEEIDRALSEWTSSHTFTEVLESLDNAHVPAGPIYSMEDIVKDEHFEAREMFETVRLRDGTQVKLPNLIPKLTESPGRTRWIGPELGAHNHEIYQGLLGMGSDELDELRRDGII